MQKSPISTFSPITELIIPQLVPMTVFAIISEFCKIVSLPILEPLERTLPRLIAFDLDSENSKPLEPITSPSGILKGKSLRLVIRVCWALINSLGSPTSNHTPSIFFHK